MDKAYRKLEAEVRDGLAGFGRQLTRIEDAIMSIVDDIKAEVAKNREVTSSAVKLLELLSSRMQSAVDNRDLEGLQTVLDEVRADTQTLADAVAANTIAEPRPAPPVEQPSMPPASEPVSEPEMPSADPSIDDSNTPTQ